MGIEAAIIGSSVVGGLGSIAGANAQSDAADAANAVQLQMYEQTREDLTPYRDQGLNGLNAYTSTLGFDSNGNYTAPETPDMGLQALSQGFQSSPGYQFQFDEGMRAVQNSAAARGMLGSGRTLKDLTRFGQGVANQDYWNFVDQNRQGVADNYQMGQTQLDRLSGLATMGQNSAVQIGNAGQNYASAYGANTTRAGAATASGYAGLANSVNNGLGQWMQHQGYNRGYNA